MLKEKNRMEDIAQMVKCFLHKCEAQGETLSQNTRWRTIEKYTLAFSWTFTYMHLYTQAHTYIHTYGEKES